jgi:ATP-dependent Lon protease
MATGVEASRTRAPWPGRLAADERRYFSLWFRLFFRWSAEALLALTLAREVPIVALESRRTIFMKEKTPESRGERLPILPLRNSVLFPASVVPINVGRPKSVALIEEVVEAEKPTIGIVSQRKAETEDPVWDDLYEVGTAARILKVIKLGHNNYSVVLQGIGRIRVLKPVSSDPYLLAEVERVVESAPVDVEAEALAQNLKETARKVIQFMPNLPREASSILDTVNEPGPLADLVASNLTVSTEEKQKVLESFALNDRLRLCLHLLSRQLEVLKVRKEISSMVQEEMGRSQREYFLRQQMKAIKEELGDIDDEDDDIEELRERLESAGLPPDTEKVAKKQLARLRQMQASSAEYTVVRTYVEWLADLPWSKATTDKLDVPEVRRILDEDHYDLEKVKKRILEYIAVRKLKADMKGPILCFVGPPGVGKTSLGRSIARAVGREFIRASLGGIRDEAEIRGHRRTYVGALPGRIIQGMKKAATINPIFMLDEIDKLGHDFRGDPSSALLEVLDPEQNYSFSDHYLEVPYDLSKVMFIATANVMDTIPPPLLDRMEVIEIPGYTREEKRRIATEFLIPKQLKEHGLTEEQLAFSDAGLGAIIDSYTREAGVRNLEREIASVCRGVAVEVAEGKSGSTVADEDLVRRVLGPEKFIPEMAERTVEPGVATGLAWTQSGGDILFIEATKMPGKGQLTLTGQLGGVMKESAQTATSFVRSRSAELGIDEKFYERLDLHIHVPAGAIPKDGPSAGVTMYTALASLLTGRRVKHDVAMTGEITLRGMVLPVGGIKEKILAAHRAGIKTVILPKRNEKDLIEVPEEIRRDMQFAFVQRMDEVLKFALEEAGRVSKTPATEGVDAFDAGGPRVVPEA